MLLSVLIVAICYLLFLYYNQKSLLENYRRTALDVISFV